GTPGAGGAGGTRASACVVLSGPGRTSGAGVGASRADGLAGSAGGRPRQTAGRAGLGGGGRAHPGGLTAGRGAPQVLVCARWFRRRAGAAAVAPGAARRGGAHLRTGKGTQRCRPYRWHTG